LSSAGGAVSTYRTIQFKIPNQDFFERALGYVRGYY
jgi:hypothetical protein